MILSNLFQVFIMCSWALGVRKKIQILGTWGVEFLSQQSLKWIFFSFTKLVSIMLFLMKVSLIRTAYLKIFYACALFDFIFFQTTNGGLKNEL